MNRNKLINAIGEIATAGGYNFQTDVEALTPHRTSAYPAMWLAPPKFESMSGRNHGKVIYSVKLHAVCDGLKYNAAGRNTAWTMMESDLLNLFSQLSEEDFVVAIEQLKMQHSCSTMTNHGEVATTATANVITFF